MWSGVSKPVFIPSSILIVGLILFAASSAQDSQRIFGNINSFVAETIGWWYILIVTLFVVFALYVALSKIGNIRLGADDDRPELSTGAWFAMLFSAGMGIGLVFWGVAEPLNHLINPPSVGGEVAEGIAAADQAMTLTFFHWGLHASAIYVVIGLGLHELGGAGGLGGGGAVDRWRERSAAGPADGIHRDCGAHLDRDGCGLRPLLRALRYEVSTTARYLRIVGGSSDLPVDVPTEAEAEAGEPAAVGSNGEEPELVVAVHQLSPAAVEVDPETGNVHLVEEPYGADPLADLVGAEHFGESGPNGEQRSNGDRAP